MKYLLLLLLFIPSVVIADDWSKTEKSGYKWTSHYHWRMDGTKGFKIHYEINRKEFGGRFPDIMRITALSALSDWRIARISSSLSKSQYYNKYWWVGETTGKSEYYIRFDGILPQHDTFILTLWMHKIPRPSSNINWCLYHSPLHDAEVFQNYMYYNNQYGTKVINTGYVMDIKEDMLLKLKYWYHSEKDLRSYEFYRKASEIYEIAGQIIADDNMTVHINLQNKFVDGELVELTEDEIRNFKSQIEKLAIEYNITIVWSEP